MMRMMGCKEESSTNVPTNPTIPKLKKTPKNLPIDPEIPNDPSIPLFKFGEKGGATDIEVKVGEKFIVQRYSNPTTGYQWKLEGTLPACVELVSTRELPGPKRSTKIEGGGSDEQLLFSARSGCIEKIQYVYTQPWMPPAPEDNRIILSLRIEPDTPNDPSIPLFNFGEKGGAKDIKVKVGDKFIVQRYSCPSTGYQWKLEGTLPACVELVSTKALPGPKRASDFVGGGSDVQLLFSARSVCTEKIQYIHTRSWMPPAADDDRIILSLVIE